MDILILLGILILVGVASYINKILISTEKVDRSDKVKAQIKERLETKMWLELEKEWEDGVKEELEKQLQKTRESSGFNGVF